MSILTIHLFFEYARATFTNVLVSYMLHIRHNKQLANEKQYKHVQEIIDIRYNLKRI